MELQERAKRGTHCARTFLYRYLKIQRFLKAVFLLKYNSEVGLSSGFGLELLRDSTRSYEVIENFRVFLAFKLCVKNLATLSPTWPDLLEIQGFFFAKLS